MLSIGVFNISFAAENTQNKNDPNQILLMPQQNHNVFKNNLSGDINYFGNQFQETTSDKNYVPIEAKVGYALIGAMSNLSLVLENSLIPFISVFLTFLFIFWVFFETYQMMTSDGKARKLAEDIVKKLVLIIIWVWIINFGPAQLFMYFMTPILAIGSAFADLILNSVTALVGFNVSDTCMAIQNYVGANGGSHLIEGTAVSEILCVPTRLSGFFYTGVVLGFKWMAAGIGTSAFTFVIGALFVVLFIYNIYKFALMALGVIFDLFLSLVLLPFTAIAECFGGGGTTYKGYGGEIFNKFMELFKSTQSLNSLILKFINSSIYFVSLSIAIALSAAILSGLINLNTPTPTIANNDFLGALLGGILVSYLLRKADEIAKKIGGSINDSFGKQTAGDIKNLWGKAKKSAADIIKLFAKK